jgi:hypothetical protein
MGPRLRPCPSCARHVRVGSTVCPFCATATPADFERESEPDPPRAGLSRCVTYEYVARTTPGAAASGAMSVAAVAAFAALTCACYGGPCAGVDMSAYTGPSCPTGSPVCGQEIVGFSDTCVGCLETTKGCPAFNASGSPCTVQCDSSYYTCFCACAADDKTCWAGCLANASSSCRSCIDALDQCAATTCKSACSGG